MKNYFLFILLLLLSVPILGQCISGDCNNGFGKAKSEGGTYTGYFKNGFYHGLGVYNASNGDIYHGEFYNGNFQGYGYYIWKNKSTYLGSYLKSTQNGTGIYLDDQNNTWGYEWKNGNAETQYSSEAHTNNPNNCSGNCVEGVGLITNSENSYMMALFKNKQAFLGMIVKSESIYNGQLHNGKPNGFGVLKEVTTYAGYFKNGKKHGKGIQIGLLGNYIPQEWDNGINKEEITTAFNASTFKKELKLILDKPLAKLKQNASKGTFGSTLTLQEKFMSSYKMTLNDGILVNDFLSIHFNKSISKTELVNALNGCSYLEKSSGNSYKYGNLNLKINENYGLQLEINYPESTDISNISNCISGDCQNGFGKKQLTKSVYEGNFKNGLPHGKGKEVFDTGIVFEGNYENGSITGKGTSYDKDGNTFTGTFKNGQKIYGTSTWKSGNEHTGNWKNNNFNGQGTFTWADKSKFVGNFKNGKKEGNGKVYYPNGKVLYDGTWKNDTKENGKQNDKDGTYTGAFKNNLPHGQGTFIWKDNSKYVGTFTNGKRTGKGKAYTPDGKIQFDGTWQNNFLNNGTQYYTDGKYIGPFKNSKPHGYGKFYNKDGSLRYSGEFVNGNPKN